MCLSTIKFSLSKSPEAPADYILKDDDIYGIGFKAIRTSFYNGREITLNFDWENANYIHPEHGTYCKPFEAYPGTNSSPYHKYIPGFHILLSPEHAKEYGINHLTLTGWKVFKVAYKEILGFGTQSLDGMLSGHHGDCVIAAKMKILEEVVFKQEEK